MSRRDVIGLRGIVIASEWAPDGTITAVDIAGYDERRYRVADDPVGDRLKTLVQKRVVVDGSVDGQKGRLDIRVARFVVAPVDGHADKTRHEDHG